jgi:hypothetical protein
MINSFKANPTKVGRLRAIGNKLDPLQRRAKLTEASYSDPQKTLATRAKIGRAHV